MKLKERGVHASDIRGFRKCIYMEKFSKSSSLRLLGPVSAWSSYATDGFADMLMRNGEKLGVDFRGTLDYLQLHSVLFQLVSRCE